MTTITDEALDQVRQVMGENERLRKALEWYAQDYDYDRMCSQWDGGFIAREALWKDTQA